MREEPPEAGRWRSNWFPWQPAPDCLELDSARLPGRLQQVARRADRATGVRLGRRIRAGERLFTRRTLEFR